MNKKAVSQSKFTHPLSGSKSVGLAMTLVVAGLFLTACGSNIVSSYAPKNEQENAELDMEAGRYSQAAERLNTVLTENAENYSARSLLAAAYAAQAGITTLSLIKNAGSAGSGTGIQKFNAILPDITLVSLTLMGLACDAMAAIPSESRTTEMKLQYSLFFPAYAFMQIKYFTTNADALANLSTDDAAKLIQTLAKAGEAGGSSPLTTAATSLSATLSASPGDSINKVKTALGAASP